MIEDKFKAIKSIAISFEVTTLCNLKCPYCYTTTSNNKNTMSTRKWIRFAELLIELLPERSFHFHITGGEPLMNSETPELLNQLLKLDKAVTLGTNGVFIPEKLWKILESEYKRDLFVLEFSLDGTEPFHNITRREYKNVINNLVAALEKGIESMVKTTVHKGNIHNMPEWISVLNEIGKKTGQVLFLEIQPMLVAKGPETRNEKWFKENLLPLTDYLEVGFKCSQRVEADLPFIESQWRFIDDFENTPDRMCYDSACWGCETGFGLEIRQNGDITFCEMDDSKFNITTLSEIQELEKILEFFVNEMKPVKRCMSCAYHSYCGMCRLMPLLHGYPRAFGFKDCREFMNRIAVFHEHQLTS